MAEKVSRLPVTASLANTDLFPLVRDPSGAANNYAISSTNLFGNLAINVTTTKEVSANTLKLTAAANTPATSIDVVPRGKIWFDANYLYIAVADNTIKRVLLSTF